MKYLIKIFDRILNIVISVTVLACIWIILQIFFFTSFRIPSDSMEPVLEAGDVIFINKLIPGARLFNLSASMQEKQVKIYRIPGTRDIRRNDVLVFNFPHPNNWNKIEMHILKYYIKRCIGLPGDTLSIQNGMFHISKINTPLGDINSQYKIKQTLPDEFPDGVYKSFPFDSIINWNIRDFGPLYIPRIGDELMMNRTNYILYRKLIEWEQKEVLEYRDSLVFLNGKSIGSYNFQKNYYFMAGDKGENSQDSRYWGLLPEEYIVGKAAFIWKSVDPYTGKFRWERFFKTIH